MNPEFTIRPVQPVDIPVINDWARSEGFAPGTGDIGIYRQTDSQGIWTGCLGVKIRWDASQASATTMPTDLSGSTSCAPINEAEATE